VRLLNDGVLEDRYEVVVVGAGIGGMTAAALLAKKGVRVLVIEQHYIPGGCCTAIRRNDITFDVGAAVFFGCGDKGFTPHRFVMNELEEEINLIPHEAIYRLHMEGKTVTFWRDMERYLDEMAAMFPNEEKGLRSMYKEMKDFYVTYMLKQEMVAPPTEIPWKEQLKNALQDPLGIMKIARQSFIPASKVMKKHIRDPKLIGFFDYLISFFTCCTVDEVPAIIATTMFVDSHIGGACYAQGSPQMLPNKLEAALEKNGGKMLYRHMVDEILIEDGKAYGVRLTDGTEIAADHVVANATVWNLYGKLVKPRHISKKRMAWAQKFEPTLDLFLLYLGVKAEAIPEDAQPIELLIDDIKDFNARNYGVFVPSLEDPSLAPPGTHSMTVLAPSKSDVWPDRFGSEYQSEEYYRRKQEETEKVIDDLDRMYYKGLKDNIISVEAATPATMERFTLKNGGNIGGPKLSLAQSMMKRPKAQSDWKNLYLCGDSTTMGEGVISTTCSGVGAANLVLRDMGIPEYLPRKHAKQYIHFVEGEAWTPPPDVDAPITADAAVRLSKECQLCEKPGCTKTCPAGMDISNFARRIEAGNIGGSARSLRVMNPLAEICGHICPSERLCQKECNRHEFSQRSVDIARLHAWVCREAGSDGWDPLFPTQNGHRVAVVGAGPAGLTCAYFMARMGYRVDVFDKAGQPGGMLTHAIPAFRLPADVVERELKGMTVPGISFHFGTTLGKDITVQGLTDDYAAAFLAPGLWHGRRLDLPGIKKARVTDALKFLVAYRKKGKASVGDRVLIIGGGSVASDAAVAAHHCGAGKVTLVCLEAADEMPCLESEAVEMRRSDVEIVNGWGPGEILSETKMRFVACTNVFDDAGRFRPTLDESNAMEMEFDEILMAVGQVMEPGLAKILKKEFNANGRLDVDEETLRIRDRTGLYAGGDIIRGAGTVVQAAADGRRAARAMDTAIRGNR